MIKRLITSIIGIIVFFAVVLAPRYIFYAAVTLFTLAMLFEAYRAMDAKKITRVIGLLSGGIICAGCIFGKMHFGILAAVILFILSLVFLHGKEKSQTIFSVAFITVAISYLMTMLFLTRINCDKYTVMLPFICAWMSDSGAYIFGSLLGKHKLCENISPKKTVEGAIFGVLFSTIGTVLYIIIMVAIMTNAKIPSVNAMVKFGLLGFFGGIISQIGDLAASAIKRDFGKKDFGNILPGHGGIFDRFDSVLITIPYVYYAMIHFIL